MHKSQKQLANELEQAKSLVQVGSKYVHYKNPNQTYTVEGLRIDEATQEVSVDYRADYDEKIPFGRLLGFWLEEVENDQGEVVSRFSRADNLN